MGIKIIDSQTLQFSPFAPEQLGELITVLPLPQIQNMGEVLPDLEDVFMQLAQGVSV